MSKKTSLTLSNLYGIEELKLTNICPRRSCGGLLTEVWVRYKDQGPIRKEKECTTCGKVIKQYRKDKGTHNVYKQVRSKER